MENTSFRFKPASKSGRIWYQIPSEPKTKASKDARIMALLLEVMELIAKR